MRKIDLNPGTYVTNCVRCNRTCHFPCHIAVNSNKIKCSAMKKRNQCCEVCPEKYYWTNHTNNDFRFETYTVTVEKSYDELKSKYHVAQQERQSQVHIREHMKTSFSKVYSNVRRMIEEVRLYIK